ncbi:MAG: hypothetical protein JWR01_2267, partial [Subtercola sp.]|nr:hypothetical protein [Subtercola sp.]
MTASESIRTARTLNGLTRTQLARMADVSPSTVTRIEAGELDPSYSMWEKLLNAAGYRATSTIESLGDATAVAAAREILTGENFDLPATDAWKSRWKRAGMTSARSLPAIALQAAVASPLRTRAGLRYAAYDRPWQQIVGELRAQGIRYAVSGLNAARGGDRLSGSAWPVIYVDDVQGSFESGVLSEPAVDGEAFSILPLDPV